MTPQAQAARLRIIADIIENDLPFQVQRTETDIWVTPPNSPNWYCDMHSSFPGIRIKPQPVMVRLDAGDVPPGSIVRHKGATTTAWVMVTSVNDEFVKVSGRSVPWDDLAECYRIKRPPYTGEWQECTKPAEDPQNNP